jgi:small subunit ribosomal protein S2
MVDTNSDPRQVDYVIPSNDDASKSIDKILTYVTNAVIEGNNNRTSDKDEQPADKEATDKPVIAKIQKPVAAAVETVEPIAAIETVEPTSTEEAKTEE